MAENDGVSVLLERTLDIYRRAAALVTDFTDALREGEPSFVPHTKQSNYIVSYGDTRKITKPINWALLQFCVPYAPPGERKPRRLPCVTLLFHDLYERHNRAYLKIGICEVEDGWSRFGTSRGKRFYHAQNIGGRKPGAFDFARPAGSDYLVRSQPATQDVAGKYGGLKQMTYFAVPLLTIQSDTDLQKLCVIPLRQLWKLEESDLGSWQGLKGMTLAMDLPEITD